MNCKRIQTSDVVTIARIVPTGMDFCASFRSPDLFEPAMMPENKFWMQDQGSEETSETQDALSSFPSILTGH